MVEKRERDTQPQFSLPDGRSFVGSGSREFFLEYVDIIHAWDGQGDIQFPSNESYPSPRDFTFGEDSREGYNFQSLLSAFNPSDNLFSIKQLKNKEVARTSRQELAERLVIGKLAEKYRTSTKKSEKYFEDFVETLLQWNRPNVTFRVGYAEGYGREGNFNYGNGNTESIRKLRSALIGGGAQAGLERAYQIIVSKRLAEIGLSLFEDKLSTFTLVESVASKNKQKAELLLTALETEDSTKLEGIVDDLPIQTNEDIAFRTLLTDAVSRIRRLIVRFKVYKQFKNERAGLSQAVVELRALSTGDAEEVAYKAKLLAEIQDIALNIFFKNVGKLLTNGRGDFREQVIGLIAGLREEGLIAAGQDFIYEIYVREVSKLFYLYYTNEYVRFVSSNREVTVETITEFLGKIPQKSATDLEFITAIEVELYVLYVDQETKKIISDFPNLSANVVIALLQVLPEFSPRNAQQKEEVFAKYKEFLAKNIDMYRADYEIIFALDISVIRAEGNEPYKNPDLGRNARSARYSRELYKRRIGPALNVLRFDPRTSEKVESYLTMAERQRTSKNPELLRRRRESLGGSPVLSENEELFLNSVDILTKINPYLVALIRTDQPLASVYIRRLLEKISTKTKETLVDGAYYPMIITGTGPAALTAIGEVTRQHSELMSRTLVLDKSERAGGPFSVDGKAWSLNSANAGPNQRFLGEAFDSAEDEERSIVKYGDPTRYLPGQRQRSTPQKRFGGINDTMSWSIAPDDLSDQFYPTNEELALVLQAQLSVSVNNYAASTEIIGRRRAPDDGKPGNKIVRLRVTEATGKTREIEVRTDAIIDAIGGGDPSYGFPLEGTRAERIVADSKRQEDSFPKLSTTLEAFKKFVSRYETDNLKGLGGRLVIVGKGNSLDTLLEYIIASFSGENSRQIKEILEKVVVIAPGVPSTARQFLLRQRTRYALIAEEIDRPGIEKLITFIDSKVSDYEYVDDTVPVNERRMRIYNEKGRVIELPNGQPLIADNIIAATGFKKTGDGGYAEFKDGDAKLFTPLVLPTNKKVQVAEVLTSDPSVMRVGVGADVDFGREKLLEIATRSPEAAKALLRVGAENLVAIGVRARETEAAVNIFLKQNGLRREDLQLETAEQPNDTVVTVTPRTGIFNRGARGPVLQVPMQTTEGVLPNNLTSEQSLRNAATSFLSESLNACVFQDRKGNLLNGKLVVRITAENGQLTLSSPALIDKDENETPLDVNRQFGAVFTEVLKDPYAQAVLAKWLSAFRRQPAAADFYLGLRSGKVFYRNTYLEPVSGRAA